MILLFEWIIQYAWEHGLHPHYSGLCNNGDLHPTRGEEFYLLQMAEKQKYSGAGLKTRT